MIELLIEHNGKLYSPVVEGNITWTTERKGCPGGLKFKVVKDGVLDITEGDAVRLRVDDSNVFYGFIFKKKRNKDEMIEITAYDQLRYLKNKDTYIYESKTASEVVKIIAEDFSLQTGTLEDTKFIIPSRVEDNASLFDIVQNALDLTVQNTNEMFVLYDNFGKITLKNISNMQVNVLIEEETAEDFDYTSSIDDNTYSKVKLVFENEETGARDVYVAKDSSAMNKWGVLQYFDTLQKGENGQVKADALLELYNKKTRNLTISNAIGDIRVRAGSLVPVMLNLGDMIAQNMMLVEKCKHEFTNGQHFMSLTLRGGEFIA